MPFDLKRKDRTYKFFYDKDEKEYIVIKPLSVRDLNKIRRRADTIHIDSVPTVKPDGTLNYNVQRTHESRRTDPGIEFNEQIDMQLVGWRLVDPEGNGVDLNRENKLIMIEIPEFYEFYKECIDKMIEAEKVSKKNSEKN
jgi:hypothetical protein